MAIENTVLSIFDPRLSIVDYVFDCRLPGVIIQFQIELTPPYWIVELYLFFAV